MNILHLSDIHFGIEKHKKGLFENKYKIIEQLIEVMRTLDEKKKPEHIIVTGDIAWFGMREEFEEAELWFKRLLEVLGLSGEDISFCVGNHDVDRNSSIGFGEEVYKNNEIMETYYSYENMFLFEKQIYNYNEFCQYLDVQPYIYPVKNNIKYSYSIGYKDIDNTNIRLVAFNSSILSHCSGVPDSEMILGREQILDLERRGVIGNIHKEKNDSPYTIAIFHHDPKFLKSSEQNEYNGKIASLNRLMEDVDLALCGHTETGGLPQRRSYTNGGMLVTSGATYYEDNHNNAFSIIHIEKEKDPKFTFYRWEEDGYWKEYSDGQLIRVEKESNIKLKNIQINQCLVKDGGIIQNGKMIITMNEESTFIELKEMVIQVVDGEVRISNDNEVARKLAIECTYKNGKTDISISIPKERYGCISAMLCREEFFWFIKTHLFPNSLTGYSLVDGNNQKILFGEELVKWNGIEDTDAWSISFLKRMINIEKVLGVRFYLPEDILDYDVGRLEVIEDILRQGYTDRYSLNIGMGVGLDNKHDLSKIRDHANRGNRFQMYYSAECNLKLWGCKIYIGKVHFLSSVYKVIDKQSLKRKIKTFQTGDVRKVNFIPEQEKKWYIIVDKFYQGNGDELKKAPFLPLPLDKIPFDMFEEIKSKK